MLEDMVDAKYDCFWVKYKDCPFETRKFCGSEDDTGDLEKVFCPLCLQGQIVMELQRLSRR